MSTLRQLHTEIKERCSGYGLKVDVISGGLVSARLAIVSTYPGTAEYQDRHPLLWWRWALLWDCLRSVGLTRNDFYTTNVIKSVVGVSEEVARQGSSQARVRSLV
jgi:uracil-DNA glycosylase